MKIRIISLLTLFLFAFTGCVEKFPAVHYKNLTQSDVVLYRIYTVALSDTTPPMQNIDITGFGGLDTLKLPGGVFFAGERLVEEELSTYDSIKIVRISDGATKVYHAPKHNRSSYERDLSRTPFNADNWKMDSDDGGDYSILETDFD